MLLVKLQPFSSWQPVAQSSHGVSFVAAWSIPGVATYALTLFFSKLVAYTFLYWLPMYIYDVEVGGRRLDPKVCACRVV